VNTEFHKSKPTISDLADIARGEQLPIWPLFSAAQIGRVRLRLVDRPWERFPVETIDREGLPSIVLVGDIDPDRGPKFWPCVRGIRLWEPSLAVILQSGAGELDYAFIIKSATSHQRIVAVETSEKHVRDWRKALRAPKTVSQLFEGEGA
jgi:hypothetical protein